MSCQVMIEYTMVGGILLSTSISPVSIVSMSSVNYPIILSHIAPREEVASLTAYWDV